MAEIGIKFYPKSFVALIDILGFKSIIENSESEEYNMVFQNLTEIVSSQHTYTLTYPETVSYTHLTLPTSDLV